jgi:hypothetical protein
VKSTLKCFHTVFAEDFFKLPRGQWRDMTVPNTVSSVSKHGHLPCEEESDPGIQA